VTGLPIPAEPVFPAGYPPVTADFTGWVTNSMGFCTKGVVFRAEQDSAQSFSANTQTVVTFDTVLEDPYSGWNAGSNEWLAPVSGWFAITSTVIIAASSGTLTNTVLLDGTTQYAASAVSVPSTNPGGSCATFWIPMIAGTDFVQIRLFMTAAGTTDAGQGQRSTLEIEFVAVQ
jgi:hypothetical protein